MTLFNSVRLIRRGWCGFHLLETFILMIAVTPNLLEAAQSTPTSKPLPASTPHTPIAAKPDITVDGDTRAGKGLFEKYCVTCHGPRGKGDGLEIVGKEVADLTSAATQRKLRMDLLKTIHEGRPEKVMPSWKWRLTEQQAGCTGVRSHTKKISTNDLMVYILFT